MRKIFFALLAAFMLLVSEGEAAKIDAYRNAFLSNSFTLKYGIQKVPVIQTNSDGILSRYGFLDTTRSFDDAKFNGIIVFDGDNSYIEISNEKYETDLGINYSGSQIKIPAGGRCALIKDGELFEFFWDMKKNQKRYYGGQSFFGTSKTVRLGGSGRISDSERVIREYNFGMPEIARALMPILPPEMIISTPQALVYKFFNSGTLDSGLTYEDFISDNANIFSAIRYYFNGSDMAKIAQVSYVKANGKIIGYEKSVIHIKEFSTAPDQNYLKLPEGLKVKRDKEAKK